MRKPKKNTVAPPAPPVKVGDSVFRVMPADYDVVDTWTVITRTVASVAPQTFTLDRPVMFAIDPTRIPHDWIGRVYFTSEAAAIAAFEHRNAAEALALTRKLDRARMAMEWAKIRARTLVTESEMDNQIAKEATDACAR